MLRKELAREDQGDEEGEEVLYKIEVPANRYDLLCLEGLSRALRIFGGLEPAPTFSLVEPPGGAAARQRLVVKPEVRGPRGGRMERPFSLFFLGGVPAAALRRAADSDERRQAVIPSR